MSTASILPDAEHMRPPTDQPTLTELISGIVDDTRRLVKQQAEMVRAEFKEDMRRTKTVVQCLAVGAVLCVIGALFLTVAGVLLFEYLTGLPAWASWAIIGGALVVGGGIALFIGSRVLTSYNPLPDKSLHALQENVSWIANPQS